METIYLVSTILNVLIVCIIIVYRYSKYDPITLLDLLLALLFIISGSIGIIAAVIVAIFVYSDKVIIKRKDHE